MAITIANRIRNAREKRHLTQREVAERMGVSIKIVSFYETSARIPGANSLVLLADALECTTDYLLGRARSLGDERIMIVQKMVEPEKPLVDHEDKKTYVPWQKQLDKYA